MNSWILYSVVVLSLFGFGLSNHLSRSRTTAQGQEAQSSQAQSRNSINSLQSQNVNNINSQQLQNRNAINSLPAQVNTITNQNRVNTIQSRNRLTTISPQRRPATNRRLSQSRNAIRNRQLPIRNSASSLAGPSVNSVNSRATPVRNGINTRRTQQGNRQNARTTQLRNTINTQQTRVGNVVNTIQPQIGNALNTQRSRARSVINTRQTATGNRINSQARAGNGIGTLQTRPVNVLRAQQAQTGNTAIRRTIPGNRINRQQTRTRNVIGTPQTVPRNRINRQQTRVGNAIGTRQTRIGNVINRQQTRIGNVLNTRTTQVRNRINTQQSRVVNGANTRSALPLNRINSQQTRIANSINARQVQLRNRINTQGQTSNRINNRLTQLRNGVNSQQAPRRNVNARRQTGNRQNTQSARRRLGINTRQRLARTDVNTRRNGRTQQQVRNGENVAQTQTRVTVNTQVSRNGNGANTNQPNLNGNRRNALPVRNRNTNIGVRTTVNSVSNQNGRTEASGSTLQDEQRNDGSSNAVQVADGQEGDLSNRVILTPVRDGAVESLRNILQNRQRNGQRGTPRLIGFLIPRADGRTQFQMMPDGRQFFSSQRARSNGQGNNMPFDINTIVQAARRANLLPNGNITAGISGGRRQTNPSVVVVRPPSGEGSQNQIQRASANVVQNTGISEGRRQTNPSPLPPSGEGSQNQIQSASTNIVQNTDSPSSVTIPTSVSPSLTTQDRQVNLIMDTVSGNKVQQNSIQNNQIIDNVQTTNPDVQNLQFSRQNAALLPKRDNSISINNEISSFGPTTVQPVNMLLENSGSTQNDLRVQISNSRNLRPDLQPDAQGNSVAVAPLNEVVQTDPSQSSSKIADVFSPTGNTLQDNSIPQKDLLVRSQVTGFEQKTNQAVDLLRGSGPTDLPQFPKLPLKNQKTLINQLQQNSVINQNINTQVTNQIDPNQTPNSIINLSVNNPTSTVPNVPPYVPTNDIQSIISTSNSPTNISPLIPTLPSQQSALQTFPELPLQDRNTLINQPNSVLNKNINTQVTNQINTNQTPNSILNLSVNNPTHNVLNVPLNIPKNDKQSIISTGNSSPNNLSPVPSLPSQQPSLQTLLQQSVLPASAGVRSTSTTTSMFSPTEQQPVPVELVSTGLGRSQVIPPTQTFQNTIFDQQNPFTLTPTENAMVQQLQRQNQRQNQVHFQTQQQPQRFLSTFANQLQEQISGLTAARNQQQMINNQNVLLPDNGNLGQQGNQITQTQIEQILSSQLQSPGANLNQFNTAGLGLGSEFENLRQRLLQEINNSQQQMVANNNQIDQTLTDSFLPPSITGQTGHTIQSNQVRSNGLLRGLVEAMNQGPPIINHTTTGNNVKGTVSEQPVILSKTQNKQLNNIKSPSKPTAELNLIPKSTRIGKDTNSPTQKNSIALSNNSMAAAVIVNPSPTKATGQTQTLANGLLSNQPPEVTGTGFPNTVNDIISALIADPTIKGSSVPTTLNKDTNLLVSTNKQKVALQNSKNANIGVLPTASANKKSSTITETNIQTTPIQNPSPFNQTTLPADLSKIPVNNPTNNQSSVSNSNAIGKASKVQPQSSAPAQPNTKESLSHVVPNPVSVQASSPPTSSTLQSQHQTVNAAPTPGVLSQDIGVNSIVDVPLPFESVRKCIKEGPANRWTSEAQYLSKLNVGECSCFCVSGTLETGNQPPAASGTPPIVPSNMQASVRTNMATTAPANVPAVIPASVPPAVSTKVPSAVIANVPSAVLPNMESTVSANVLPVVPKIPPPAVKENAQLISTDLLNLLSTVPLNVPSIVPGNVPATIAANVPSSDIASISKANIPSVISAIVPKANVPTVVQDIMQSAIPANEPSTGIVNVPSVVPANVPPAVSASIPSAGIANVPSVVLPNMESTVSANVLPVVPKNPLQAVKETTQLISTDLVNVPSTVPSNVPSVVPENAQLISTDLLNLLSTVQSNVPSIVPGNVPATIEANVPSSDIASISKANIPSVVSAVVPKANMPTVVLDTVLSAIPANEPSTGTANVPSVVPANVPPAVSESIPAAVIANVSPVVLPNIQSTVSANVLPIDQTNALPVVQSSIQSIVPANEQQTVSSNKPLTVPTVSATVSKSVPAKNPSINPTSLPSLIPANIQTSVNINTSITTPEKIPPTVPADLSFNAQSSKPSVVQEPGTSIPVTTTEAQMSTKLDKMVNNVISQTQTKTDLNPPLLTGKNINPSDTSIASMSRLSLKNLISDILKEFFAKQRSENTIQVKPTEPTLSTGVMAGTMAQAVIEAQALQNKAQNVPDNLKNLNKEQNVVSGRFLLHPLQRPPPPQSQPMDILQQSIPSSDRFQSVPFDSGVGHLSSMSLLQSNKLFEQPPLVNNQFSAETPVNPITQTLSGSQIQDSNNKIPNQGIFSNTFEQNAFPDPTSSDRKNTQGTFGEPVTGQDFASQFLTLDELIKSNQQPPNLNNDQQITDFGSPKQDFFPPGLTFPDQAPIVLPDSNSATVDNKPNFLGGTLDSVMTMGLTNMITDQLPVTTGKQPSFSLDARNNFTFKELKKGGTDSTINLNKLQENVPNNSQTQEQSINQNDLFTLAPSFDTSKISDAFLANTVSNNLNDIPFTFPDFNHNLNIQKNPDLLAINNVENRFATISGPNAKQIMQPVIPEIFKKSLSNKQSDSQLIVDNEQTKSAINTFLNLGGLQNRISDTFGKKLKQMSRGSLDETASKLIGNSSKTTASSNSENLFDKTLQTSNVLETVTASSSLETSPQVTTINSNGISSFNTASDLNQLRKIENMQGVLTDIFGGSENLSNQGIQSFSNSNKSAFRQNPTNVISFDNNVNAFQNNLQAEYVVNPSVETTRDIKSNTISQILSGQSESRISEKKGTAQNDLSNFYRIEPPKFSFASAPSQNAPPESNTINTLFNQQQSLDQTNPSNLQLLNINQLLFDGGKFLNPSILEPPSPVESILKESTVSGISNINGGDIFETTKGQTTNMSLDKLLNRKISPSEIANLRPPPITVGESPSGQVIKPAKNVLVNQNSLNLNHHFSNELNNSSNIHENNGVHNVIGASFDLSTSLDVGANSSNQQTDVSLQALSKAKTDNKKVSSFVREDNVMIFNLFTTTPSSDTTKPTSAYDSNVSSASPINASLANEQNITTPNNISFVQVNNNTVVNKTLTVNDSLPYSFDALGIRVPPKSTKNNEGIQVPSILPRKDVGGIEVTLRKDFNDIQGSSATSRNDVIGSQVHVQLPVNAEGDVKVPSVSTGITVDGMRESSLSPRDTTVDVQVPSVSSIQAEGSIQAPFQPGGIELGGMHVPPLPFRNNAGGIRVPMPPPPPPVFHESTGHSVPKNLFNRLNSRHQRNVLSNWEFVL